MRKERVIRFLCVGDGDRDRVAVPPLVEGILGCGVEADFEPWARLHQGGKGLVRRLGFAVRQARSRRHDALVAVVDADRSPPRKKLKELRERRDEERQNHPPFPTALGEAVPHLEAWLLDDPVAVREALALPATAQIPTVRQTQSPKQALDGLISTSLPFADRRMDGLRAIAELIEPDRCQHKDETGFDSFRRDVTDELAGLLIRPDDSTERSGHG